MKRFAFFSQSARVACWLTVAAVLLAACSQPDEYHEEDVASGTQSSAVTVTDENGNQTTFLNGTAIGVYVIGEDGSVTLQMVSVGGDGYATLPAAKAGYRVIAYTPYQTDWNTSALDEQPVFTVQSDQSNQSQYNASDLMMGTIDPSAATDNSSLRFQHKLARVAIHTVDETGRMELDQISVKLHSVKNSVNVDLRNQTVTTIDERHSDILMLSTSTTDWRISSYAIVAPQTITEGTTFVTVMLFGVNYTFPMPQTTTLEGGQTFTMNVRFTLDGLILEGWHITDWNDGEERNIEIES